ncbi:hypothetical protein RHGRI_024445 [Rhododendron griersonianum]|uniref:Cytochrome P450 n=1 Tax=Rhododendron griersonianum TaxID=479676 RepID=A0AAV6J9J6_9ERIC|nr:hypothetical protein RHGRI_024445 [Rhododendron griersonianum]
MLLLNSLSLYFLPLLFFILFLYKFFSKTTHKNLPPSPLKLPLLGNLHQLGRFPHRSLCSLAQKYGPLMLLHFGNVPVLVVSSAVAAREILKTHDLAFSSRPKLSIASRLLYDLKGAAFSPYGDHWRQVKSICVLHVLSNKRVQSYRNVREEETALMMDKIRSHSCSSSSLVNLTDVFVSLTYDIVCRVTLGRKYDGAGGGTSPVDSSRHKKFQTVAGKSTAVKVAKSEEWKGREEDGVLKMSRSSRVNFPKAVVMYLLQCISLDLAASKISNPLYSIDVKCWKENMFVAGTDTTFTALEWTMTELLRHPQIMKKLQNEVRDIARGKLNVTEDDLDKMHYLKAVMKESFRLHTPAPLLIPRESIQDVHIMGYDIAAGTRVLINAWAIGRDPLSWEDPEEMRPERFLNSSIDFKGQDFEMPENSQGNGSNLQVNVQSLSRQLAQVLSNPEDEAAQELITLLQRVVAPPSVIGVDANGVVHEQVNPDDMPRQAPQQIMSNGMFKSPVLRVVTNSERERLTLAVFCLPDSKMEIGLVEELIDDQRLSYNGALGNNFQFEVVFFSPNIE